MLIARLPGARTGDYMKNCYTDKWCDNLKQIKNEVFVNVKGVTKL